MNATSVVSDNEDDALLNNYTYEPAKPIHIPIRIHDSGRYTADDKQGTKLQTPSMVMV